MKILSWNIWVDGDFEETRAFLKNTDADIIGLQEVLANDPDRDVITFLKSEGYECVFAMTEHSWDGKTYQIGPAIFTKLPITNERTFFINKVDKRAVAQADIMVGDETLHVFSIHLVHTHQMDTLEQNGEVEALINELPTKNTIVVGDFNATPSSAVIQKMNQVLIDTDPSSAPTWSVYPKGCGTCSPTALHTKLDYIFVSRDLTSDSFCVLTSKASDHLPISVRLIL